jgi:hypothetical protein
VDDVVAVVLESIVSEVSQVIAIGAQRDYAARQAILKKEPVEEIEGTDKRAVQSGGRIDDVWSIVCLVRCNSVRQRGHTSDEVHINTLIFGGWFGFPLMFMG